VAADPILIGEVDSRTGLPAAQGLAIAKGIRVAMLRHLAGSRGLAILAARLHVRTLLLAAHRAYVLDGGPVVAAGSGTELQEDPRLRRALYGPGAGAPA
jgi:ABC-type branched-subunit amino acid transport system ATPase component